jgi:hypothetical protein
MTLWCLQAAAPAGNGVISTPTNGEKAACSSTSSNSLVLSGEGVTEALLQRLLEQMHGPEVELKGVHPTPPHHSLRQTTPYHVGIKLMVPAASCQIGPGHGCDDGRFGHEDGHSSRG